MKNLSEAIKSVSSKLKLRTNYTVFYDVVGGTNKTLQERSVNVSGSLLLEVNRRINLECNAFGRNSNTQKSNISLEFKLKVGLPCDLCTPKKHRY